MIEDKNSLPKFCACDPSLEAAISFFSSLALVVSRFTTCDSIAYHQLQTFMLAAGVNFTCDCQHSLMPASNHTISSDEQKFQYDFLDHQQMVRRSPDSRMIRKIWKMNIFISRWSRPRGNQERGQPPVKVNVIHIQMLIVPLPGLHPLPD